MKPLHRNKSGKRGPWTYLSPERKSQLAARLIGASKMAAFEKRIEAYLHRAVVLGDVRGALIQAEQVGWRCGYYAAKRRATQKAGAAA